MFSHNPMYYYKASLPSYKTERKLTRPRPDSLIYHPPILLLLEALLQEDLVFDFQQSLFFLIRCGQDLTTRLTHAVHDRPEILGLTVRVGAGGLCAKHGGAVAYGGVHIARDQDGHVASGGDEADEDIVLALRAGHEDGVDVVAGLVESVDDLLRLQGDELERCVVVDGEAVEALVAGEANDGAGHARVGNGRAVTEQISVEEEVARQIRDARRLALLLHLAQVLVQVVIDVDVVGLGQGRRLVEGRMRFHDVSEQLARGRLPTLGHPEARDDGVAVRAPDARHEDRVGRHGKMARGRACDRGQTGERLTAVIRRGFRVQLVARQVDFGTHCSNPSCIGIDDTTADGNAGREAQICSGFLAESARQLASTEIFAILWSLANQ